MTRASLIFLILAAIVFGTALFASYFGWMGQSSDVSQSIRAISAGRAYSGGNVK